MRRLAALVGTLLLAGCSANAAVTPGVLGDQADTTRVCTPLTKPNGERHSRVLVGVDVVRNPSDTPLTVTDVALSDPQGITLTRARLATLSGSSYSTIGGATVAGRPYPGYVREGLAGSRPAEGATIAPGERVSVILFLSTDSGRMGTTQLTYDQGGEEHLWTGGTSWRFPVPFTGCK